MPLAINNLIGFGAGAADSSLITLIGSGAGNNNSGATSISIDYPTGIAANDLLILYYTGFDNAGSTAGDTTVVSSPSGFTQIATAEIGAGALSGQCVLWAGYKVAAGSESGSLSCSFSGLGGATKHMGGRMSLYRNTATSTPTEAPQVGNTGSSTTVSQPSYTTGGANRRILCAVALFETAQTTASFTGETNGDFTEQTTFTGSTYITLQLQHTGIIESAATVSGGSYTVGSATASSRIVFAIKPP